jgi:hypothetical protein
MPAFSILAMMVDPTTMLLMKTIVGKRSPPEKAADAIKSGFD